MNLDPLVLDTLNTIQVAASLGPGSFGAYVISQATCASDVLAVMLLQVREREREEGQILLLFFLSLPTSLAIPIPVHDFTHGNLHHEHQLTNSPTRHTNINTY